MKIIILFAMDVEKRYELMCESVVKTQDMIYSQASHLKTLKASNPKMVVVSHLFLPSSKSQLF